MEHTIQDMIGAVAAGRPADAQDAFEGIISQKLHAAIDAKKIEVGQSMIQRQAETHEDV